MSTETEAGDDRMEKINVRVPEALLERIDDEWEQRGYASKSAAIRDALREWVATPADLSEETQSPRNEPTADRPWRDGSPRARDRLGIDD
jgi:Predicted transcriptional regulators containing the CopG/Arc/MetJ DNA-binding domain and a metal-binding domain